MLGVRLLKQQVHYLRNNMTKLQRKCKYTKNGHSRLLLYHWTFRPGHMKPKIINVVQCSAVGILTASRKTEVPFSFPWTLHSQGSIDIDRPNIKLFVIWGGWMEEVMYNEDRAGLLGNIHLA